MTLEVRLALRRGDFTMDVAMRVPAIGAIALCGPSGCGKTTLLRCLAGLDRHPGATVRVGDQVWQDGDRFVPPHQRALGYVFQETSLFAHLSVADNVAFGWKRLAPGDRRVSREDAVALLGIQHLLQRKPDSLSAGEKQRVAIARAVASSPQLLLMDEPLASLDDTSKRDILPFLDSLCAQLSVPLVYVSHSTDEVARLAETLVLLEQGQVLASGSMHDLLTRLDLPLAHQANAEALIEGRVSGQDDKHHLTEVDSAAGRFLVIQQGLADGSRVRLRIAARDVSVTLSAPTDTSILNRFPATIAAIEATGDSQVTIRLHVGDTALLSRVTRKSATELALKPGKNVYVQVKSVALLG